MRHIAPGGRIDGRHADFGGPGHFETFEPLAEFAQQWTLAAFRFTKNGTGLW